MSWAPRVFVLSLLVLVQTRAQSHASSLKQSPPQPHIEVHGAEPVWAKELSAKRTAVTDVHGKLEGSVKHAVTHMNDAARIKHQISVKQAQLRGARGSRNILQDKVNQVDQVRDRLLAMLHKDMDPKIDLEREVSKRREQEAQLEAEKLQNWTALEGELKSHANQMVRDLQATRHQLKDLHVQLAMVKQLKKADEKNFEYNLQMAKQEEQSLTYAEKQYQSESSRLRETEAKFKALQSKGEHNLRELARVADARRNVQEEQDRAKDWDHNRKRVKAQVDAMVKLNHTSYDAFLKAESKEQELKQKKAQVEKQFVVKQNATNHEAEELNNVELKRKIELSHSKAVEASAKFAKEQLQHLEAVRAMEANKIELFHAHEHNRLQKKISDRQIADGSALHDIADLGGQYAKWEQEQQMAIRQLADVKRTSKKTSEAYEAKLHESYKKMHQK